MGERSAACLEELGCPPERHKRAYVCKWYAPGQEWIDGDNVWRRVVIEVSEALELEFRGRNPRGEVWVLTRVIVRKRRGKEKKDKTKVTGEFVEAIEESHLPEWFDVDPTLCHVYREIGLPEPKENPLPDRPLSEDQPGLPPTRLLTAKQPKQPAKPVMTDEDRERLREARNRIRGGRPVEETRPTTSTRPIPSTNGTNGTH